MMCILCVACAPASKPENAKKALEDAGYEVILNDKLLPDGIEAMIIAFKGDDNYIAITYYEDKDALNEAWDEAKDGAKELEEEYKDIVCEKSGKMIYMGTKQAVKDAR